jgi:DNA-binding HxlR family transcriptional regulator
MACSIARTMDVIGEWWTPLILRDLFVGITRFDDLRRDLGIATNVLTDRLGTLAEHGVLERRRYQARPDRYEYVLTDKGRDLFGVVAVLVQWGDRWEAGEAGPPMLMIHDTCGHVTAPVVACDRCATELHPDSVTSVAGPGGRIGPGTTVIGPVLGSRAKAVGRPEE